MVLEMNDIKVIKTGGGIVENPMLLEQFIKDFSAIDGPKILVHGGGVMASQLQRQLGQQPVMIDGRRVTDMDTLKVVTMVYAGWCSKSITALLQKTAAMPSDFPVPMQTSSGRQEGHR